MNRTKNDEFASRTFMKIMKPLCGAIEEIKTFKGGRYNGDTLTRVSAKIRRDGVETYTWFKLEDELDTEGFLEKIEYEENLLRELLAEKNTNFARIRNCVESKLFFEIGVCTEYEPRILTNMIEDIYKKTNSFSETVKLAMRIDAGQILAEIEGKK